MIELEQVFKFSKNLKVLYVEDDQHIRECNEEILEFFFKRVDLAGNAQEGIACYSACYEETGTYYDIVITDIRMPGIDGIELARQILARHPEQHIIVLSAHNDGEALFQLINLGISHYLLKPLVIEQFIGVIHQVTKSIYDVRLLEEKNREIRQLNTALERKIDALNDAVTGMEEMSRNKARFFAGISHEIRNPINALIGLGTLLHETPLNPEQRELTQKIVRSSNVLLQLVNDILDHSKIEAGKLELEQVTFDINTVLEHLADMLRITTVEKGIELVFEMESDVPALLLGDPLRLGQILLNLLGNAVKFTDHGYVILRVSLRYGKILFEVIDSGIGMSGETLRSLFSDYVQAESSTSRHYGGTGLGLTISKQLVTLMKGHIHVESTPGEGSIFSVYLPLHVSDARERRHYRLPSIRAMNKNVLLIDTHGRAALALEKQLDYFRHRVTVAATPHDALMLPYRYDLIFVWESYCDENFPCDQLLAEDGYVVAIQNTLHMSHASSDCCDTKIHYPTTPGSVFQTLIGLYDSDASQETEPSQPQPLHPRYENARILLAEDNYINQRVVTGLLSKFGVDIICVSNGAEVLERFEAQERFDLILMDIHMPVMDGHTASRRLRERGVAVPIIGLSGDVSDRSLQEAGHSGMQTYLEKPINIEKFYEMVTTYLEHPSVS